MVKPSQKLSLLDQIRGLSIQKIFGVFGTEGRGSPENKKQRKFKIGKARWIGLALLSFFMAVRVFDPGPLETVRLKVFDYYQNIKAS